MNNSSKKEKESYYLKVFQSLYSDFPKGEIIECEKPDFIISSSNNKLGVEITNIYRTVSPNKKPPQIQEAERHQLIKLAQRFYEENKLPHLDVRIFFGLDTHFNKKNRNQYANIIMRLVVKNLPKVNTWKRIHNDFSDSTIFPFEIDTISIAYFDFLIHNLWTIPCAGWKQEEFHSELQAIIDRKNALLSKYNPICQSHWLLVVADGTNPSSFFDPSEAMLNESYNYDYEHVFFLNMFDHKLCPIIKCAG